jgi:hypothetical protein
MVACFVVKPSYHTARVLSCSVDKVQFCAPSNHLGPGCATVRLISDTLNIYYYQWLRPKRRQNSTSLAFVEMQTQTHDERIKFGFIKASF